MLPSLFPEESHATSTAILALSDGTVFKGISIGAEGHTVAEIVFNTAMTGYQEILTDPSYRGQIVALTYPHIGNTGINAEDSESTGVQAAGLVVRDCASMVSNFRSEKSLPEYLKQEGIVAIAGVDTRKLTRILRENGAQGACILVGDDAERAIQLARSFVGMVGQDLAKEVSVRQASGWTQGSWGLGAGFSAPELGRFKVAVYDFGVKANILRLMADRGCDITVYPAQTPVADILATQPDGVFLSNGPGDPEACSYAVEATKAILDAKVPVFGICLGHQILGLAVGGQTVKMKTGHHGANHPVQEVASGRVFITSQNHGFAVDTNTLPATAKVTHISLFDGTLQGFELTDRPAFGFQGHPEATPGPRDIAALFDTFINLMEKQA